MGISLMLNRGIRDNYAFIDPESPVSLNLMNPRGNAPRLTNSILRGLRAGTIIDVNGIVDLERGELRSNEKEDEIINSENKEKVQEVVEEKKAETKKAPAKAKKSEVETEEVKEAPKKAAKKASKKTDK